jgi:glutamate synthase (NADPH/NADH) large chain
LGADAFCAYLLLEAGVMFDAERAEIAPEERVARLRRLITGLCKGLEKVISTMGTHELRGYGRNFAGIGVAPSIAAILEIPTFCASESVGLTLAQLEREARRRYAEARAETPVRERRDPRFFPKIWKIAGQVAEGLPLLGVLRQSGGDGAVVACLAAQPVAPAPARPRSPAA